MRSLWVAAIVLLSSAASAQDCNRFTSEARPAGEVVATVVDDWTVEIADTYGETVRYRMESAGTGIPYQVGYPEKEPTNDEAAIKVLEHGSGLIIDMMPFAPFCD